MQLRKDFDTVFIPFFGPSKSQVKSQCPVSLLGIQASILIG